MAKLAVNKGIGGEFKDYIIWLRISQAQILTY